MTSWHHHERDKGCFKCWAYFQLFSQFICSFFSLFSSFLLLSPVLPFLPSTPLLYIFIQSIYFLPSFPFPFFFSKGNGQKLRYRLQTSIAKQQNQVILHLLCKSRNIDFFPAPYDENDYNFYKVESHQTDKLLFFIPKVLNFGVLLINSRATKISDKPQPLRPSQRTMPNNLLSPCPLVAL